MTNQTALPLVLVLSVYPIFVQYLRCLFLSFQVRIQIYHQYCIHLAFVSVNLTSPQLQSFGDQTCVSVKITVLLFTTNEGPSLEVSNVLPESPRLYKFTYITCLCRTWSSSSQVLKLGMNISFTCCIICIKHK